MNRLRGIAIAFASAIILAALLVGCTAAGGNAPSSSSTSDQKDVSSVEQLQVSTVRHEIAEVGEQTGHGAYGEYTEVVLESEGYDALKAALEARNAEAAAHTQQRVSGHANDPEAAATPEGHDLNVALGGADGSVEAVPFINFLNAGVVTRADSNLVCLLEAEGAENEGWGKKVRFASCVYDAQTGAKLALSDLVGDTSQLPALIDEALHAKYAFDGMWSEGEDAAAVVRAKLDAGSLAFTADYLGMRFYFDSADFKHADTFQGMYVSIPYAAHPGLFADACTATPDDFIAQLEYDVAYALPGDADGRTLRIERAHQEGATLGLLGTSPVALTAGAGWTFIVQVGTGEGDGFEPTGEATNSPWYYDVHRQDYAPCLVRVGGRTYLYGFGDRNSDDLKTCVYDLNGAEPDVLADMDEGFVPQVPYAKWAFPCNPAAVVMADCDCLAAYDRVTFERDCAIRAETGLPSPAADEADSRAHTVNEAYKLRVTLEGTLVDEAGTVGATRELPEGTVCVLESGRADDHYDMRLEDGSLVRLPYDARTMKIAGHYGKDVISVVPAAAAASARIESGPRQRTVRQHGRDVPLVPETGNIVGTGAILDYGDTPWWVAEEFVGTWKTTDADRAAAEQDGGFEGSPNAETTLVIREDGTLTLEYDGKAFEGSLDETRGWGVYAHATVQEQATSLGQDAWLDYKNARNSDESWERIKLVVAGLPYPESEKAPGFGCYLTRAQ